MMNRWAKHRGRVNVKVKKQNKEKPHVQRVEKSGRQTKRQEDKTDRKIDKWTKQKQQMLVRR